MYMHAVNKARSKLTARTVYACMPYAIILPQVNHYRPAD